jgi:fructokinase
MGQKSYDVVALGELLIDFTENGISEQGNPLMEANPGGAPCNVLAMLKKFGRNGAFIGKVGDDMFGRRLRGILNELGINSDNLQRPSPLSILRIMETVSFHFIESRGQI